MKIKLNQRRSIVNRIKFLSVVTVCSSLFVSLLHSTHCFSNEAAVTSESTNTTKKDSPLNHLDVANEQYKQGLNYAKYGLYDEAIEMYKKSLLREPNNSDAYKNMGIAYLQKEKYDEAIEALRKVIELKPKDYDACYSLGTAYFDKGVYDKAIENFKKTLHISPEHKATFFLLGIAYAKVGKYDD